MTPLSSVAYSDISLDELITYSIHVLIEEHEEATFENIVAKSFELFPEKFSLIGYPQWPDSARVNKAWLRCRTDFKYIKGTVKSGFALTPAGLAIVERVQKKLKRPVSEKIIVSQKKAKERSKEEQFMNELEQSDVFKRYLSTGGKTGISHFEFCDMLYCTLESSARVLNENLEKLKGYAQKLSKTDALNFLLFVEEKFYHLLKGKETQNEYSGGMNKVKQRRV